MSLWKHFRDFFARLTPDGAFEAEASLEAEEKLTQYLIGLINRQDLISDLEDEHEALKKIRDLEEKKLSYAKLYFKLENFLVTNKPLVTKKEFADAKAVRADMALFVAVDSLGTPLRLVLSSESQQAGYLFATPLSELVHYIRQNLGEDELTATFASSVRGTLLENAKLKGDTLLFSIGEASLPDVRSAFKKLYKGLFERVQLVVGEKTAVSVAKKMYDSIALNFDQPLLSLFLDIVPEGLLESEKLLVLSRGELEKRVIETTRGLQSEKEGVEQKVVERTQELKQKVEELYASNELLTKREAELTVANDRLMELDKIKTEFISVAAHQLRTPLSAIKWTLSLVIDEESKNLTSEQRSLIMKGYESNERIIRLVNEMLVVTRIESGKMQFNFSLIHVEDLIDSVLLDFAGQVHTHNMHLAFERPGAQLPYVNADPEKIRAVIQNLIENALNYTKDGGIITLSVQLKNNFVRVQVKDNGIGIPLHQRLGIFNKFFRADNASKAKTDGSGLGLFVAKSIVDKHRGQIGFESAEGVGTTFYFTIPCAPTIV